MQSRQDGNNDPGVRRTVRPRGASLPRAKWRYAVSMTLPLRSTRKPPRQRPAPGPGTRDPRCQSTRRRNSGYTGALDGSAECCTICLKELAHLVLRPRSPAACGPHYSRPHGRKNLSQVPLGECFSAPALRFARREIDGFARELASGLRRWRRKRNFRGGMGPYRLDHRLKDRNCDVAAGRTAAERAALAVGVVVADPDRDSDVVGESYEPGVILLVGGAGLAGDIGERPPIARAVPRASTPCSMVLS